MQGPAHARRSMHARACAGWHRRSGPSCITPVCRMTSRGIPTARRWPLARARNGAFGQMSISVSSKPWWERPNWTTPVIGGRGGDVHGVATEAKLPFHSRLSTDPLLSPLRRNTPIPTHKQRAAMRRRIGRRQHFRDRSRSRSAFELLALCLWIASAAQVTMHLSACCGKRQASSSGRCLLWLALSLLALRP